MSILDKCSQVAGRSHARPVVTQILQMIALFVSRRIGPGYYFLGRFWRRTVPLNEQLAHFNEAQYRRQVNRLNHPAYQKMSQHKVVEKAVLSLNGVPTPAYIGFFHPQRGCSPDGSPLRDQGDLEALLRRFVNRRVCFKVVEGSGGAHFAALDVVERQGVLALIRPLSDELLTVASWSRRLAAVRSGWILEEFVSQHPLISAFNPDSVNTLRVIVLARHGNIDVRGAVLRLGRSGSQVDNTSGGGLACPIDLATGAISEALDMTSARNTHFSHPDSGVRLQGVIVPYWPECRALACRATAAFPQMNFAGVDIAITDVGPVVIELNVCPDRRFAAHLDLPHGRLFGDA